MKFRILIVTLFLIMLAVAGCQPQQPAIKTSQATTAPTPMETMETLDANMGGVTGRAMSNITNQPLGNTIVRLAEVVRQNDQAAFVLDTAFSPGTISDENGNFTIMNVPAQEYVIVVGNVEIYQGYEILQDASGKANTYTVTAGEILDVGDLRVNLTGSEN
jgi:hypothetical protein